MPETFSHHPPTYKNLTTSVIVMLATRYWMRGQSCRTPSLSIDNVNCKPLSSENIVERLESDGLFGEGVYRYVSSNSYLIVLLMCLPICVRPPTVELTAKLVLHICCVVSTTGTAPTAAPRPRPGHPRTSHQDSRQVTVTRAPIARATRTAIAKARPIVTMPLDEINRRVTTVMGSLRSFYTTLCCTVHER